MQFKKIYSLIFFISLSNLLGQGFGSKPPIRYYPNQSDLEIIRQNEIRVTQTEYTETDFDLDFDKRDPSKIVMTMIQHKFIDLKENIISPIYYSSNSGQSWNRSQQTLLPYYEYDYFIDSSFPRVKYHAGDFIKAWITTTYLRNYPSAGDTVVQQINYAISNNNGVTWEYNENDFFDKEIVRVPRSNTLGLLYSRSNLHLFELGRDLYCIYTKDKLSDNKPSDLVIRKFIDSKFELLHNISLPDSLTFFDNMEICNINDFEIGIIFTSYTDDLGISYARINVETGQIMQMDLISNIFFKAGSTIPYSEIEDIPGVNPRLFSPTPKIVFNNGTFYSVWTCSGIDEQEYDLNVYFSRSIDGGRTWTIPKVLNSELEGDQFYPTLAAHINGTLAFSWFDKWIDPTSIYSSFCIAFSNDQGETIGDELPINSYPIDRSLTPERNNDHRIGRYVNSLIVNDNLLSIWTDTRDDNGNIDLFSAQYPIMVELKEFIFSDNNISVGDPYPNPTNSSCSVLISNSKLQNVSIGLYTSEGKLIRNIINGSIFPGNKIIEINTENLADQFYHLRVKIDSRIITKKIVVIK